MRVLFWSESFWPHIGGAEVLAVRLVAALRQRGYTLAVVTQQDSPDQDAETQFDGVPIYRFPFSAALGAPSASAGAGPGKVRAMHQRIAGLKRDFAPDLVHAYFLGPGIFFHLHTPATRPVPWTVTLHSVLPEQRLRPETVLGRALRAADWVSTCSEAVLALIHQVIPEIAPRTSVIRNALEMPAVRPQPLRFDAPLLLCLGRLIPEKGFDLALAAFAALAPRYPSLRLIVAGDGPARADLERQAADLNLGLAVKFVGRVSPEDVPELMNTATVFVMPSRWPESFGLAALQAAQMARPVVAARIGGLAELVSDHETGILVEKEDPVALAEAIATLLDDPQAAVKMGEAGRRRAQELFGWTDYVDAYDRLFHNLAQKVALREGRAGR